MTLSSYSSLDVGFALRVTCPHALVGSGSLYGSTSVIEAVGLCLLAQANAVHARAKMETGPSHTSGPLLSGEEGENGC